METQTPKHLQIYDIFVIGFLLTFIILRLFVFQDQNMPISLMTYMGLVGSVFSLYLKVRADCKQYRRFDYLTGIFTILFILMGAIAFLILGEVIVPNNKANDIISLFSLLLSTPSNLIIYFIEKAIINEEEKYEL